MPSRCKGRRSEIRRAVTTAARGWPVVGVNLGVVVLVAGLLWAPAPARAQIIVEVSVGQGMQLAPRPAGAPQTTSIMVAAGYIFLDTLRPELGLVAAIDAMRGGAFDLEIRPMVTVAPETIPFYVRVTGGVVGLLSGAPVFAIGASVGIGGVFNDIGLFIEGGFLPREGQNAAGAPKMRWIIEARLGAFYAF